MFIDGHLATMTITFLIIGLPMYFVGYHPVLQPFLFNYHKEKGIITHYDLSDDDIATTGSIVHFKYQKYGQNVSCSGPIYNMRPNSDTQYHYPKGSTREIFVRNGYDGICYIEYPLRCYAIGGFIILSMAFLFLICCCSATIFVEYNEYKDRRNHWMRSRNNQQFQNTLQNSNQNEIQKTNIMNPQYQNET